MLSRVDAADLADSPVMPNTIRAVVPGQVHTDLMANGLLDDPDVGLRESDQLWIGHASWRYSRMFTIPADSPALSHASGSGSSITHLVADGLDTVASVTLNGTLVAHTIDQHIRYRWDIGGLLREGENQISVQFDSAWDAARDHEREVGPLPGAYDEPYAHIRKSASNFGWDWGPHYVTAGIWQPIRLETFRSRIDHVRPLVTLDTATARVDAHVTLESAGVDGGEVRLTLRGPSGRIVSKIQTPVELLAPGTAEIVVTALVDEPELWWPVGLGAQPLYGITTELVVAGEVTHVVTQRIGFRSIEIDESPDSEGTRWAIVVNGRRVRIRGYNWIPDDPFVSEVTAERVTERLDQAVDGGANLLRVWGGGYFATEEFLDGCDERGLLVWQDFLFACSSYDESTAMIALIREEAEQAVARLSAHASVALWCGGNECVWGWNDWGWRDILGDRPWGERIFADVLPEVVARLDPTRPYLPNSPWSSDLVTSPNGRASGPTHLWDVWNALDFAHYRKENPSFVSEMGWCGPPAWSTLADAVIRGELLPSNPEVAHHMRASDGVHKLMRGILPHFATPTRAEDWHFVTQLVQARAEIAGTEWLRSRERCAGVVIWQLNDCWPVMSWAAVDSSGIEKPLWFGLRRSFAARLLSIQPLQPGTPLRPTGDGGLEVVLVNDGTSRWEAAVTARRISATGEVLASQRLDLVADPDGHGRAAVDATVAAPGDEATEFVVVDSGSLRATWFYRPDRELLLPSARWRTVVQEITGGVAVVVSATSVVRDLCLFADRIAVDLGWAGRDLRVDDMLVTLLPGETARFEITRRDGGPWNDSDVQAVRTLLTTAHGRPALRAAND